MILANSTWEDAKNEFAKTKLAILPIGSIEAHGPHNPTGVELFLVEEIAKRLEKRVEAIVVPVIPVSCARLLADFPGTLWVKPATLHAYLMDVCGSLIVSGVRKILFLNGHGSNVQIVEDVARSFRSDGVVCAQIDLWRFVGKVSADLGEGKLPLGHSSELPTSMMMAVKKDLVHRDRMRSELPRETLSDQFPDVLQYYPISASLPSAFEGEPARATVEKGEKILTRITDRLEEFLKKWVDS